MKLIIVLLIGFLVLNRYSKDDMKLKIWATVYFLAVLILAQLGFIRFDFIPQARALLEMDENLLYWFKIGHVHSIRLLIAYPGFILSKVMNVDLNTGFTYYGLVLFLNIYMKISSAIFKYKKKSRQLSKNIKLFLLMIPLIILPFIMNGRLIPAFLGFVILIELNIDLYKGETVNQKTIFLKTVLGLILTMVSSGTMMVSIVYVIAMFYAANYNRFKEGKFIDKIFVFSLCASPLLYIVFKYTVIMLNRNIVYYGGGFRGAINTLQHGLGRIFVVNLEITVIFMIVAFCIFIFNFFILSNKIKKFDKYNPICIAINISIYGFLFGHSTGLMIITPLIIFFLIKI